MEKDYFSHLNSKEKQILKNKGTEAPFTGEYNEHFEPGIFICRACENPLYESNTKFNSGCGWPSFDDELEGAIVRNEDLSGGRSRIEICCSRCNGHLGHLFNGEQITEKNTRHCVNSLSIKFILHNHLETATFGAGCFWDIEKIFRKTRGVYLANSGYMGGGTLSPTYKEVGIADTNHTEVVNIHFNPKVISYINLLDIFWKSHNPTTSSQQGTDGRAQSRSVIFYYSDLQKASAEKSIKEVKDNYSNPIITQIIAKDIFYRAEEYHQNYLNKNNLGSSSF